jgi:cyclic pyranopterin phosphate synthase
MMPKTLKDSYGRKIDYLRVSVTDRCNLKCFYCTPSSEGCHLDRSEILSFEEIIKIIDAAVSAGITKIRVTGGEPLIRRGLVEFCDKLSHIDGIEGLSMTTNGILLKERAAALYRAGVERVNISLDTFQQKRFEKITGFNFHDKVMRGIREAEICGFYPIKINVVVMRGINDDEIEELASLTLKKPYHVRFIELMPTSGWADNNYENLFMPVSDVIERLKVLGVLRLDKHTSSFGPERTFRLPGAIGRVGFISPISQHFCRTCNRLRLTADGKLKSCLFSNTELDIKSPIRAGANTEELIGLIREAATQKPERHRLSESSNDTGQKRIMCAIGG